ncbi:GmrSD restriction endonuclease domain-containing protein [Rhodobacter capsulatus]|uniref:GmrSD restriction endonuclease domain-containing protein n=1 Tax=Rhodobacter capsulatus TaxID=1061 RepID=UPI0013649D5B|nr:DUF262 domain-containing protein [Rhodobacter capsulatus]
MSIQEAYRLYVDGKLQVNRKYQRKLVWSEQEKRHLIDSLQKNFPVPLFMFARVRPDDVALEVIDGMQRLNAIFSFMEHQFMDESGKCFDVLQNPRTKIQKDSGGFSEFSTDVERWDDKQCASFLEYQLAVTIDTEGNSERINEVFGRINSGGRRLSPQEQRQAGLISGLSEFVRRLAMELRGDSSPDILLLKEMPSVSFNTPKERQGYGVDASDIFWCKHGIILPADLAKAEDEQVVSDIAISILNGSPLNASREVFDNYFDGSSADFVDIERKLAAYGAQRLHSEIISVIGNIRATFETGDFLSIRSCVQEKPKNTARTAFYAIFFAYYELIIKEGKIPDNFEKIRSSLNNSQKALTMQAHYTTTADREANIGKMIGLIQKHFVKNDVAALGGAHSLVVDIENSLRRSKYETSRYEFKIGCCELSERPVLDEGMFKKLARTAAAIANTSPDADGYIYLGVADKESAANRVNKIFGSNVYKIGEVFFVGLNHDLACMKVDMEHYVKRLIKEISATPLDNTLKTQLITSLEHAEYRGAPFVRLRVPKQPQLTLYDGEYPIRKDSNTVNMTAAEAMSQSKLFSKL